MNATRELSAQEIDQVSGGFVFIPIAYALGKGLLVGIAAGTIVATALDALDIGTFEI